MRSQAEFAEFALNNVSISGNNVSVVRYFPQQDPLFYSNPVYQRLGQFIGQDHVVWDPQHFRPWSSGSLQSAANFLRANSGHQSQAASGHSGAGATKSSSSSSSGGSDLIGDNTVPWSGVTGDKDDDECSICMCDHDNSSLSLSQCLHTYHRACLESLIKHSSKTFIECPKCRKVYGIKMGNMPTTGTISHCLTRNSLPGYEGCGWIQITFNFAPGIQGPEHPNPGQPYRPQSFPGTAYLPDNKDGELALHGIYMAWNQRFLFTVGTSVTSGMRDCITWNDIHMKTSPHGGEHGYPDPNYLKNLREDLKVRGITEAAILEHLNKHPQLRNNGRM